MQTMMFVLQYLLISRNFKSEKLVLSKVRLRTAVYIYIRVISPIRTMSMLQGLTRLYVRATFNVTCTVYSLLDK